MQVSRSTVVAGRAASRLSVAPSSSSSSSSSSSLSTRRRYLRSRLVVRAETETQAPQQDSVSVTAPKAEEGNFFTRARRALKESVVPQVYDPEKEEFAVDSLLGVRAMIEEEGGVPFVEYLVKWKDGSPCTWERATRVGEDVLRDYENKWWAAAREGDAKTLEEMLRGGKKLLANTLDENRRCALHFTAAIGNADCTKLLIDYGADPNVADKEGYTPLHMAGGYLHTTTVIALIEAGADSEQKDRLGRDPMGLVDNLRSNLPSNVPQLLPRRAALEAVARVMVDSLFEDVEPAAIIEERPAEAGRGTEYLVRWKADDLEPNGEPREDSWVNEKDLAEDVVADWKNGLEWATAEAILDKRRVAGEVQYLVKWDDKQEDSWEPEQNVAEVLIREFEDEQDRAKAERRAARKAAKQSGNGSSMAMA